MSTYFAKCTQLWDEYIVLVAPCTYASTGSAMKLIERQQFMQFLMGLGDSYHMVKSNILMLHPLPSVSQASNMVFQEKQQKEIKNAAAPIQMEFKASTFIANQRRQFSLSKPILNCTHYSYGTHPGLQPPAYSQSYNSAPSNKRTNVQCNYYRRLGHTIDQCSKLQRLRNESNQGKRMATSMQHSDSCSTYNDAASNKSLRHHTLTVE